MALLQRSLAVIYPDQCLLCDALVEQAGGLCPACWAETPFLDGHTCDACATPLPGNSDGVADHCDDCLAAPRPWKHARAAFRYAGGARRMVLGLKHADRLDLVPALTRWMAQAGADVLADADVLVPVPIHWSRRIRRRYNQSAELCHGLSRLTGIAVAPDALKRLRATKLQDGLTARDRYRNQQDSIVAKPAALSDIAGASVLLIDDVMTSGATLSAATGALHASGANRVSCLLLARATKAP